MLITQSGIPKGTWELVTFSDSEIKPVIKDSVRGEDVVILQSTSNPVNDAYMEVFLLADALRRSACKRIILVMPYYGYARQNQQHLPGEPVSAQVVARILESVGVDELVTVDLHEEQLTGFFTIPVNHLSALPLLAKRIAAEILSRHAELVSASTQNGIPKQVRDDNNSIIVISPDQGGVERTRKFRDALDQTLKQVQGDKSQILVDEEIGIVEKLRNLEGVHESKVVEITGTISGKIAVIPDDVIVSGGTILHAVDAALEKGATKVYLAATHADFIPGTSEKLQNSKVEKVFVGDTIMVADNQKFEKLQVVSMSQLLAEQISKLKVLPAS